MKSDSAAVTSAMVVLHLITPDTAGEIDSTLVGPAGAFSFDLPRAPDPVGRGDVYFASVTHQGILYFGSALSLPSQLDSTYLVLVHDTAMVSERSAALPLALRYLILDPAQAGWLVTDVFQIENEGDRTLVAPEGQAVWIYPLPPGATDLEAGGGDVSPESISLIDGSLHISAPLPPGVRQFMVRYRLERPRLELRMPGLVHQVELLVREPAPELAVQGLMANQPAELEPGVTYRRFSAVEVRDQTALVTPGEVREAFPIRWLAVLLALVLAGVSVWAFQRGAAPAPAGGVAREDPAMDAREQRERLLLEVAGIDERLETGQPSPEERERAAARRRMLIEEIRRLG